MYFLYNPPQNVAFWMKSMLIPIDIVWIANNKVIGIEKNIQPPKPNTQNENLKLYEPDQPVNAVLELSAGATDQYNIQIGDSAQTNH